MSGVESVSSDTLACRVTTSEPLSLHAYLHSLKSSLSRSVGGSCPISHITFSFADESLMTVCALFSSVPSQGKPWEEIEPVMALKGKIGLAVKDVHKHTHKHTIQ